MPEIFDPIVIRYDGLDAANHEIDLALLGESLKGGARLLAVAAELALTGTYVSRIPAMSIRVLASTPRDGCFEIPTVIVGTIPVLPLLSSVGRELGKKTVEAIVNYMLARLSKNPSEAQKAMDVAMAAIQANKEVTLKSLDTVAAAMTKAADDQRPAARGFASPVGTSVATAIIGPRETAMLIDQTARDVIDADEPLTIGAMQTYTIKITELDIENGSCKFVLEGPAIGNRYLGTISDPVVGNPHNPYSAALDTQSWIKVMAKPHLDADGLKKLTISDTAL